MRRKDGRNPRMLRLPACQGWERLPDPMHVNDIKLAYQLTEAEGPQSTWSDVDTSKSRHILYPPSGILAANAPVIESNCRANSGSDLGGSEPSNDGWGTSVLRAKGVNNVKDFHLCLNESGGDLFDTLSVSHYLSLP
jgi:hypothetical protein